MHEEDVRPHRAVRADDGLAAHDGRARVDGDVVLDGRVALLAFQRLPARERARHEADALIHLHMVPDGARLADDRAGAVVHEEVRADARAGVQVHAAAAVRPLGHDARQQHDVLAVKLMRHALHSDGLHEGVGDDDFLGAEGGGVAVVSGLGVGLEDFAQAREAAKEGEGEVPGFGALVGFLRAITGTVFEALEQFVLQAALHRVHEDGGLDLQLGGVQGLFLEEAGEEQPQQIHRDAGDGGLRRKVFPVEVVDATNARVGGEQVVGELGDGVAHGAEYSRRAPCWQAGQKGVSAGHYSGAFAHCPEHLHAGARASRPQHMREECGCELPRPRANHPLRPGNPRSGAVSKCVRITPIGHNPFELPRPRS